MADITLNRYNVISFPDNSSIDDITEGIVEGSLNINEMLFSGPINYGEANANKFEASVYNLQDVVGEKIQVYQMDNEVKKYLFTGYVDSCKLDEYAYYRNIVAYDILYKASGIEYDLAVWWSNYWSDKTSDALGNVLRAMLNNFNIPYVDITLPLDDFEIGQYSQIQKMSLTDMLSLICSLNMCTPNVNREGYIEFVMLNDPNIVNITDAYAGGDSEFESYNALLYDKINIYNENDELVGSYGTGDNVYDVRDNILIYGKNTDECNQLAQTMYHYLCTTVFIPASVEMIVSNFDVKVGDVIITSKGNHLVCEQEYHGTLLIDQTITSRGDVVNKSNKGYNAETQRLGLQLQTLQEAFNNKILLYLIFDNDSPYDIKSSDQEETTIVEIPFKTNKKCYVVFHASVIFNLITDSSEVTISEEDYISFNDGDVQFQFVVNDLPILDYTPKVTYQDGTYTIHLEYAWYDENEDESLEQTFKVICSTENCEVTIPAYRIHGYLTSDGLVVDSDWDGKIFANETFNAINFNSIIEEFSDEANVTVLIPQRGNANDSFGVITFNSLIGDITDSLSVVKCMYFSTVVNTSLLDYTATISNNTFVNGEVVTPDIYDISNVSVKSTNTSYQVSFDGETWVGYSNNIWTENIYMSSETIENIPQSAWNSPATIKAIISESGTLTNITITGGHL